VLETRIVKDALPRQATPRQVEREFVRLLDAGARLRPAGEARSDPESLLSYGYTPKHALELFGTRFYLTNLRKDENFRFFVGYVVQSGSGSAARRPPDVYPRIFYKDSSLVWRCATHVIRSEQENWIGKGDLKTVLEDGAEEVYSAEETTNLPLELQAGLDAISRRVKRVVQDWDAIDFVLRGAPDDRLEPYDDFLAPRRHAAADPDNLVNHGEYVARFERPGDPTSLYFVPGFEPDFEDGIVDTSRMGSRLYGGKVQKFRILSRNRQIQYQFIAAPRHVWIIPPQTLTTELSSYGVRTIDVHADEDLFVPGYEYHFIDDTEEPPALHSQIPRGFVGPSSDVDPDRADAAPWLEKLPVIQEFRRSIPLDV
jgi:hypothetical protein